MKVKYVVELSEKVDVYDYQLCSSSIDGIMIRIGYRNPANGELTIDSSFYNHYNGVYTNRYGAKIGFYWQTHAISIKEAKEEATYIRNRLKDAKVDFPIYIKESFGTKNKNGRADNLSRKDRTDIATALCNELMVYAYSTGIYIEKSWAEKYFNLDTFSAHNSIWLIDHSMTKPADMSYDGWEYTGSGSLDGIDDSVNMSRFYNNVAGWGIKDIGEEDIKLTDYVFTYNGNEKKPFLSSPDYLTEGTDYTLSYENNIKAGTGIAIFTGIGDYTGTKRIEFTIERRSIATAVISLGARLDDGSYDLSKLEVRIDKKVLIEGEEFKKEIKTIDDPDTHYQVSTIIVTGIGNYIGTQEATYDTKKIYTDINTIEMKLSQDNFLYTGQECKPEIITTLTPGKDYSITYSNNINAGTGIVTVTGKDAYISSRELTFTISPILLTVENTVINVTITNDTVNSISVTYNGKELVKDIEYSIEMHEAEVGYQMVALITITGKGNYSGTISADTPLYVIQSDIKRLNFHLMKTEYEYAAGPIIPDYSIEVVDPLTVRVSNDQPMNYYDRFDITNQLGSISSSFIDGYYNVYGSFEIQSITGRACLDFYTSQSSADYYRRLYPGEYVHSGMKYFKAEIYSMEQNEKVEFDLVNNKVEEGVDYEVEVLNNVDVGIGIFHIKGMNFYEGSIVREFKIVPYDIVKHEGYIDCGEPDENGCYKIRKVRVKPNSYTKRILNEKEVDVNINYAIQGNYKIAYIRAVAKGNYTGTLKQTFRIEKISDDPFLDDVTSIIELGQAIEVKNLRIYPRYATPTTKERVTGIFYLWDLNVVRGRVRITRRLNRVGIPCQITGWVNITDLYNDHAEYYIGDEVIVTGSLFLDSKGNGQNIYRDKAIMYITDKKYKDPYPYGVANARNRLPIAYGNKKMIKHYFDQEEYTHSSSVEDSSISDNQV